MGQTVLLTYTYIVCIQQASIQDTHRGVVVACTDVYVKGIQLGGSEGMLP